MRRQEMQVRLHKKVQNCVKTTLVKARVVDRNEKRDCRKRVKPVCCLCISGGSFRSTDKDRLRGWINVMYRPTRDWYLSPFIIFNCSSSSISRNLEILKGTVRSNFKSQQSIDIVINNAFTNMTELFVYSCARLSCSLCLRPIAPHWRKNN